FNPVVGGESLLDSRVMASNWSQIVRFRKAPFKAFVRLLFSSLLLSVTQEPVVLESVDGMPLPVVPWGRCTEFLDYGPSWTF
ncbi:hypothetical protein AVEN_99395-1, partial [Araneus ventricosus]